MGVEARVCYLGSPVRIVAWLDVGLDFIWDLPMTLLLNLSNLYRHRGRAVHLLNSIQLGYALSVRAGFCAAPRAALRA